MIRIYPKVNWLNVKISYGNHWFFGQTTPLAVLGGVAATGRSHRHELVPKTWMKF